MLHQESQRILVKLLIDSLFKPEMDRLDHEKLKLIRRNHELGGLEYGFYFKDLRCADRPANYFAGIALQTPHRSLTEDCQSFYDELKKVERDQQQLKQALGVVLPKCHSEQDVRDVLPETLVYPVPSLRDKPRTREPGYLLEKYPLLLKQYKKAVEIAEYYMVNKMLYH